MCKDVYHVVIYDMKWKLMFLIIKGNKRVNKSI